MRQQVYILVHGAWHGAWCWKYIAPHLQSLGHLVLTPDLPGHGQDKTPFHTIHLSTYVNYLIDLIQQQSQPVVLVGHSFAGVFISQVAEEIPELVEQLFYVCAYVPQNQHSLIEEASYNKKGAAHHIIPLVKEHALALNVSDLVALKACFYHCSEPEDFDFSVKQLQKEPILPFSENVTLSKERYGRVSKHYIYCLRDCAIDLSNQQRMAKNAAIRSFTELDCDHSPFFSMPRQLLLSLQN